jgi:8-oxo-dGTP diphosphatase
VIPRPAVAVGIIAVDGERILLVRRGHGPGAGFWSLPGGHVEGGETLHEAVVREMAEETGLECVVDRFLAHGERFGDDPEPFHFVFLDYVVTVLDPERDPVAGDDAAEARWVPFDEVGELRLVSNMDEFLKDHGILPT